MRYASRIAVVALLLGACGSSGLPRVRVIVSEGTVQAVIDAEVAATSDQRARGLMFRTSVPAGRGMLFLFPGVVRGAFHMKDTLVPLRILFIRDGRVVEVRTMEPCSSDPCPLTRPAAEYDSALEVPLESLAGFREGAAVRLAGEVPNPV